MRTAIMAMAGALLGTMLAFGTPSFIRFLLENDRPPELWLSVTNLDAEDTTVGVAPALWADRQIHRPLLSTTYATLRRKEENGLFITVCKRDSVRHLIPQAMLPEMVTLDYWAEVPPNDPCVPETPGVYIVTLWIVVEGAGGEKPSPIEVTSNEFTVRAAS